jgi:hypothetical protein
MSDKQGTPSTGCRTRLQAIAVAHSANRSDRLLVGRGGLEPPTSRLSGVRSNHLSYRPMPSAASARTGGAYRDRTDDLLNANQALSQLS